METYLQLNIDTPSQFKKKKYLVVVVGVNGGCLYTTKIAKNKKKMKPRKKLFAFPLFESIHFQTSNHDQLSID